MELIPHNRKLSRILGIVSIALSLITALYIGFFAFLDGSYCDSRVAAGRAICSVVERVNMSFVFISFFLLLGVALVSFMTWIALRLDRNGKIIVVGLTALTCSVVGVLLVDNWNLYAYNALLMLVVLLPAATIYNLWKNALQRGRMVFFLVTLFLLVIAVMPIPVRCEPERGITGSDGGFGADIVDSPTCYSIFTDTFWNETIMEFKFAPHSILSQLITDQRSIILFD